MEQGIEARTLKNKNTGEELSLNKIEYNGIEIKKARKEETKKKWLKIDSIYLIC